MGSLTSRPKVPRIQQAATIQYVPVSTASSTAQSTTATTVSADTGADATSTEESTSTDAEREESLLLRSRGRVGTILTGFRGLLENSETAPERKSLLGE